MKNFSTKVMVLSVCLALAGIVTGQNPNGLSDFKQLLKSQEPAPRKIVKVITKTTQDNPNTDFVVKSAESGSFYNDLRSIGLSPVDIEEQLYGLFGFDADYSFARLASVTDDMGYVHTNYLVYYKGYAIDGQMVMVHQKDGLVTSINGMVTKVKTGSVEVTVSDEVALQAAMNELQVTDLVDRYPVETVFYRFDTEGDDFVLAKKVRVFSLNPLKHYNVFVSARTGKVLDKITLIPHTDEQCKAQTYYDGEKTITADNIDGTYYLRDNARNIGTYNGKKWDGRTIPDKSLLYTNTSANWTDEDKKPPLQAHWGLEQTYDYYKNILNRDSYDNNHGPTYNVYNPVIWDNLGYYVNAAALPPYGIMVYGRGGTANGTTYKPFVALDITAHEFTHLVTDKSINGGLEYRNEPGALNESFSDIFAACVDYHTNGDNPKVWLIGEDLTEKGFLRSMSDPSSKELAQNRRQPNTYKGTYWYTGSGDNGGVHTNSGVQNYWFYLLCKGGSGTNDNGKSYNITPIGIDKTQKIVYRSWMNYLPYQAKHIDAYFGSLQAAKDLGYNENSKEYKTLIAAWEAVGIDSLLPRLCKGNKVLTATKGGTITDGSGEEKYPKNLNCTWTIEAPADKVVQLTFTKFELEAASGGECGDYVAVYDGENDKATLMGKYCGSKIPPVMRSTSNKMFIKFYTDAFVNRDGFEAKYEPVSTTALPLVGSNKAISVYPNPARSEVFIRLGESHDNITVVVTDMLGRVVKKVFIGKVAENDVKNIGIEDLSTGIYYLHVVGNDINRVEKLVVNE